MSNSSKTSRVESVDMLRGILAFGVMVYHYTLWSGLKVSPFIKSTLGKIGIYGVEIFFVISGFSLYYVYRNSDFSSSANVVKFYKKRFLRIAPLFYFALASVIVLKLAATHLLGAGVKTPLEWQKILSNVTFLFGFTDPADSMVIAGWSIGVEMVFYSLFPVIVLLFRGGPRKMAAVFFSSLSAAFIYQFMNISGNSVLSSQWGSYAAFINHLFFFAGGMWLADIRERVARLEGKVFWPALFVILSAFAMVLPVYGDEIAITTGYERYIFSALSLSAAALFSFHEFGDGRVKNIFVHLGNTSYSIYLLHFFSYTVLATAFKGIAPVLLVPAAMTATLIASHFSYLFIEKPFMNLSKKAARPLGYELN